MTKVMITKLIVNSMKKQLSKKNENKEANRFQMFFTLRSEIELTPPSICLSNCRTNWQNIDKNIDEVAYVTNKKYISNSFISLHNES